MKKSELRKLIRKVLIEAEERTPRCCGNGHCDVGCKGKPCEKGQKYCPKSDYPPKDDGKEKTTKDIKEQMTNPFSNPPPGAGTGPNWATAAAAWDNYFNTPGSPASTAPQPPQAFLNRMATMGCNGKQSRFDVLMNKWSTLFSPAAGQILSPNNPLWQTQLAAKIIWLTQDLQNNC